MHILFRAAALALILSCFGVVAPAQADEEPPRLRRKPTPFVDPDKDVRTDEQWKDYVLQLGAPSLSVRVNATKALGDYRNDGALAALTDTFYSSPDAEVRVAAVHAVGKIRNIRSLTLVSQACTEDPDHRVRIAAAEVMTDWKASHWTQSLLIAISFEQNPLVTKKLLEAMEANNVDFWERMHRAMHIEGLSRRIEACDILVKLDSPRAVELMAPFIKDPSQEVRQKIAFSLGAVGRPECVPPLIEGLKDQDRTVRFTSLKALSEIASDEAVSAIVGVLARHPDIRMRQRAATYSGQLKARKAIPVLRGYVKHTNDELRALSVAALGSIGDPSVIPNLKQLLETGNITDKANAISSIGKIGGSQAVSIARANLRNNEPTIREISAYVLGNLKDRGSVQSLLRSLDDPDFRVQIAAITALGLIGDSAAKPSLIAKLEGRTPKELDDAVATAVARIDGTALN